jgi:hypothetical protein
LGFLGLKLKSSLSSEGHSSQAAAIKDLVAPKHIQWPVL